MHQKLRLLCIDDEEIGLKVRKTVLERAGYEVFAAQTVHSGIELFKNMDFDAVVIDFLMPGTNGTETAETLRKLRPEVPILLLSAYVNLPDAALQLVDAHLLKGAGPQELLIQIKDMIDRRRP